jgi:hypothetical protein
MYAWSSPSPLSPTSKPVARCGGGRARGHLCEPTVARERNARSSTRIECVCPVTANVALVLRGESHPGGRVGGVQLHDLGSPPVTRVGDGERQPCFAAHVDGVALQLQGRSRRPCS